MGACVCISSSLEPAEICQKPTGLEKKRKKKGVVTLLSAPGHNVKTRGGHRNRAERGLTEAQEEANEVRRKKWNEAAAGVAFGV